MVQLHADVSQVGEGRTPSVTPSRERLVQFDVARIVAICAVVCIHLSSKFLYGYNASPASFRVGNLYDSLSRWCVPLFIMVSGVLLLKGRRAQGLGEFYRKRASKVVLPLVAWSVIYVVYRHFHDDHQFSLAGVVADFFSRDIYFHLWFLYMITGLYLVTPVMRSYVQNATRSNLTYFVSLWFLASVVMTGGNFVDIDMRYLFPSIAGYIGYFVLGYHLFSHPVSLRLKRTLYVLAVASVFVTYFGTLYLTRANDGHYDGLFYDYNSPNVILMATGVFLAVKDLASRIRSSRCHGIILVLSNISFGVYLVHPVIRDFLYRFVDTGDSPVILIPVVAAMTILLSYLVTFVLTRIPVVAKIVP